MRRLLLLLLALLVMALAGCGGRSRAPQPDPGPPPPVEFQPPMPVESAPDLWALDSPATLSRDELTAGLERFANAGGGPLGDRLKRLLLERWAMQAPENSLLAEADLDGDGVREHFVALKVQDPAHTQGIGTLYVIYGAPGAYRVEALPGTHPGIALHAVADLTGNGRPEILWSTTEVGAHTATSQVFVTQWAPGRFTHLAGQMAITDMRLRLEGRDIILQGGLIGSAGAGIVQRERLDRYRYQDGELRLADRRYAASDWVYHRLLDGVTAETVKRHQDALADYRAALEPDRGGAGTAHLHESVPEEVRPAFYQAVEALARFRLSALLLELGRPDDARTALQAAAGPFAGLPQALLGAPSRIAGCEAGARWAQASPAFMEAINSPFGYATPKWQPEQLCGPVPDWN